MSGETNLSTLLQTMSAQLVPGVFVFTTLTDGQIPDGVTPRMVLQEAEGTTLILLQEQAERARLTFEFPSRMITLNVHSGLEAVGFMARIATALAAQGMGVNPVAGFYHDHLFVPQDRAEDAMNVLQDIAAGAA